MRDVVVAARGQRGLLTLAQVKTAGHSRAAWSRAHASGMLVPVHPGVSRLAVVEPSPEQAIQAATLATGGLASHLSAAHLWGADVAGVAPVDVIAPGRTRSARVVGTRVHRPTDQEDLRPVLRRGILTTSPLRTALDVGAVGSIDDVAGIVEQLLVARLVTVTALRRGVERHARRGRRGLGALRVVLDDWALGDKPPDSVLEPAMGRLLRRYDLPQAVFHHVVVVGGRHYELDFALLDPRVDVEVDGWAHHSRRLAFEADRERDAYLASAGWLVVRFTWHQVKSRPDWVAERIRETVAGR